MVVYLTSIFEVYDGAIHVVVKLQLWTKDLAGTSSPTLPSPYKQSWMRVFRLFCEFQLCIGWGVGKEGDLQKEALFYEGTQKFTEKY